MDDRTRANRRAWDVAAQKYVEESADLVEVFAADGSLLQFERSMLAPILATGPFVVHLQSGHGLDSVELRRAGASTVVCIDFSHVTTRAASQRSVELEADVQFVVGDARATPFASSVADLVYTGKGALMWLPDLSAWAVEVARVLRGGGYLFVYEQHPAACLWTGDEHEPGIRSDRSYFGGTRRNDSFPASAIRRFSGDPELAAVEWQWTIADLLNAVIGSGMTLLRLDEHPEPFWRPADGRVEAAWRGKLPNSISLMARAP